MTIHTFAKTKKDAEVFDRMRVSLPVMEMSLDYESIDIDFEYTRTVFFCPKDRSKLKDE